MGNAELFEMCETNPKVQCSQCRLHWNQGVIYCTCGHLLVEKANPVKFLVNGDWMLSPSRTASSRRGNTMVLGTVELKHRNSTISPSTRGREIKRVDGQEEHYEGIHDRFLRDPVYRDSQLKIGWTEQKCIEMDELAQEDHSYRLSIRIHFGSSQLVFVLIVNRDCGRAWQSSHSARQEHQWSDAEWEEWLAERSRQPWQCAFCGSTCRGKAKVCGQCEDCREQMETKERQKTSTSNPGSGSTTVTTDGTQQTGDSMWTKSISLGLHQNSGEHSVGPSRRETIRIYSFVLARGDFGKETREHRVQGVGNAPSIMQGRSGQSRREEVGLSGDSGACAAGISTGTAERARTGGGISFPGEAIVGASLVRQVQCCNGGRQLSGFATNLHEIRIARNGHEFCSTAHCGRRSPETHGTAFHVTHRPVSTVAGSQSRCKAVGFTDVSVRPSADSWFWREVPKRAGRYEHQSSVTSNLSRERDKLHVAQLEQLDSRWHHFHQFVSNGRRKRPVTRKHKSRYQKHWYLTLKQIGQECADATSIRLPSRSHNFEPSPPRTCRTYFIPFQQFQRWHPSSSSDSWWNWDTSKSCWSS